MIAVQNRPMSHTDHAHAGSSIVARCAIITLSDTRTESTDTSGATIRRLLVEAGHEITFYQIIKDEQEELRLLLEELLARPDVDLILSTGGTGVSPRDNTVAVTEKLLDLPLPGFGELFRMLSWQEIGSAAMLSRATAGIARGKPLFALPGSTKAVELGMTKLIVPQIGHILSQLRRPTST